MPITWCPFQVIFTGVYLISGSTVNGQIAPNVNQDEQKDPESLLAPEHIAGSSSALALPGFGYTPGAFADSTASPRYIRLNDEFGLMSNSGPARYNSVPSLAHPTLTIKQAFCDDTIPVQVSSPRDRVQSVPIMVRPPKWQEPLSSEVAAKTTSAPSAPDSDVSSAPQLATASAVPEKGPAVMPSTASEATAPSKPIPGAFAPINFRLRPTTSDVLQQLLATPGLGSQRQN